MTSHRLHRSRYRVITYSKQRHEVLLSRWQEIGRRQRQNVANFLEIKLSQARTNFSIGNSSKLWLTARHQNRRTKYSRKGKKILQKSEERRRKVRRSPSVLFPTVFLNCNLSSFESVNKKGSRTLHSCCKAGDSEVCLSLPSTHWWIALLLLKSAAV